jgi:4-hydroxybenzoate polyprenyltransferase
MATKKSQAKAQSAAGSNDMWKWLYVAGAVVSALAGALSFQNDILTWVLILVGVLVGIFYFDVENFKEFGIAYLVLLGAFSAFGAFVAVGEYLTGFFNGLAAFLGPVALTLLVRLFVKRNF